MIKFREIKKSIQIVIYISIGVVVLSTILGLIFGTKSCSKKEKLKELRYFMTNSVPLHNDNYNLVVNDAYTTNEITILNKENNASTLRGNYIQVNLTISQVETSQLKSHKFDKNDFKLKDHNGVYLPLNDIMSLLDINALDMQVVINDDGTISSNANFSTKNAVEDYTWIGTTILAGDFKDIILYFSMPEGYKVEEDIMILEVDFMIGAGKTRTGSDIVLIKPNRIFD